MRRGAAPERPDPLRPQEWEGCRALPAASLERRMTAKKTEIGRLMFPLAVMAEGDAQKKGFVPESRRRAFECLRDLFHRRSVFGMLLQVPHVLFGPFTTNYSFNPRHRSAPFVDEVARIAGTNVPSNKSGPAPSESPGEERVPSLAIRPDNILVQWSSHISRRNLNSAVTNGAAALASTNISADTSPR